MIINSKTIEARKVKVFDALGRVIPRIKELDTETGRALVPVPVHREVGGGNHVFAVGKKNGRSDLLFATVYLRGCMVEGLNNIDPTLPAKMTL